ncbi:hypothetical protein HHI36_021597 [Cryptolaemus montrouzieri]|uniref:C2H2-type domain-containing protein n=1 Tax=Cryptolaemus montrouzieri TaxID=559131 RepID=A0ABD2MXE7_9CUCU
MKTVGKMSEELYNNRLRSVQRFIPFLENMIEQLKDPKMKNREQQLNKMESLYGMITDKKKKLKTETLIKCEEVIVKLYQKVKGDKASLPSPLSPKNDDDERSYRKPPDIYGMAGESLKRSKINDFDIEPCSSKSEKNFFLKKPPISNADLEVLEKDVANELERKMSLQELKSLRSTLFQQLEETDAVKINTTVRNRPMLTKLSGTSPDKNKKTLEKAQTNEEKNKNAPGCSKKTEERSSKVALPKVLKESSDLFGNAFSEIDKSYEIEAKKRDERRHSNRDKEDVISEKTAQIKQLAEKAKELRNKSLHSVTPAAVQGNTERHLNEKQVSSSMLSPGTQKISFETNGNGLDLLNPDKKNSNSINIIQNICINSLNDESTTIELKNKSEKEKSKTHRDKKQDHKKDSKKIDGHEEKRHDKKDIEKDKSKRDSEKKHHERDKNNQKDKKEIEMNEDVKEKVENLEKRTDLKPDKVMNVEGISELPKEIKPLSRDPRLKFGALNKQPPAQYEDLSSRLAFKYVRKPRKCETDIDLERNVADSIEKSMKESHVPLPPPAQLKAPPAPPDDLFSPASPDEIDKAPVPKIVNDILLNPKTTGVINEVVTALKHSANIEKPLLGLGGTLNSLPHAKESHLFNQFKQTNDLHFSPPRNLNVTPADSVFVPPKPVPPPLMSLQPRGFNPFIPQDQNSCNDEMPILDYQPPTNATPNYDIPLNPPNLTPYEDRMVQGFHMDVGLNFVPPSPSYAPSSASFVPPSPRYDDMGVNNYHNFQGDRHSSGYFEKDRSGMCRSQGLLGDYPQRMPFNSSYGHQNYDNFFNNQQNTPGGYMEPRQAFYGSGNRDPRVNMKRGGQFGMSDFRMTSRDNTMTYREYREQKEKENRDRQMREKEKRDRELREKELVDRQKRAKEEAEKLEKEAKEKELEKELKAKETKEEKLDEPKELDRDDPRDSRRTRDRSRDRYHKNSSSRYRRIRDDRRDRSGERPRFAESKFDKVYSSREKDKEDFTSPLDSLYSSSKAKTGKGYGVQFKIPKKVKEEEKPKDDDKTKKDEDSSKKDLKSGKDKNKQSEEQKEEMETKVEGEYVKDIVVEESEEKKTPVEAEKEEIKPKEEPEIIAECGTDTKADVGDVEEVVENKIPVIKSEDQAVEIPKEEIKEEKKSQEVTTKKDEEESILSRFFQNLMKSSNKDEKKGALLSLISTFSDSFSDHQLQKITSIIKSEGDEKGDQQMEKKAEEPPETKPDVTVNDDSQTIEEKEEACVEAAPEEAEEMKQEVVEEEIAAADSIQVSVGERTKNRKRSDKTESKSKIKLKTELDRLHEDIREMFIRDGVVTATGKRMCRLLKDNETPAAVSDSEKMESGSSQEETKKKIQPGKKKGRKPTAWKKKDSVDVEMRELSVVLPKMSLEKMKDAEDGVEQRYSLRRPVKTTNYNENESEENRINPVVEKGEASEAVETEREETEKDEQDTSFEEPKKVKAKKKIKNSWATGVIKKKPCGKAKKSKSPSRVEQHEVVQKEEEEVSKKVLEIPPSQLHDKDYYLKPDQPSLQCRACEFSTKWIAAHYRSEHPDVEVLSSRLAPDIAAAAIADALVNKVAYEKDDKVSNAKHFYNCSFCEYKITTLPRMYRDHVSIHTGEFRHKCPYCNYRRSHIKSMQTHVSEVHAAEEATERRHIISQPSTNHRNVYGYICELCNYTQMSLQRLEDHAELYHGGSKKCKIHKIKLNLAHEVKANIPIENAKTKTSPARERTTRRSVKLDLEQDVAKLEQDGGKATKKDVEKTEEPKIPPSPSTEDDSVTADSESHDSTQSTPVKKGAKKRRKSFVKPGPASRKMRKRTKSVVDAQSVAKKIDEAVFTCNTDLQEENKRIEEERLKTMQDINSTIKLRTSLDFVEKLSNRLKQEEEVCIKEEPHDPDEGSLQLPPNDLPVFEKSASQKRDVDAFILQEASPKIAKDGGKANSIISGVIEKLKGVLSGTPGDNEDSKGLPPLKHKNEVERKVDFTSNVNSQVLNIGPIKIIKSADTSIYACCSPPCIFSSRDQQVFAAHCQFEHDWDANIDKFPNCLECGMKLDCNEFLPLLTSALNHATINHSDFLNIKIGSIRISSNLFPDTKTEVEDKQEAASSDSAISTPPILSIPSPPEADVQRDSTLSSEIIPNDFEDENPFSFKIVDVVSLAEENIPPLSLIDQRADTVVDYEPNVSPANITTSPKRNTSTPASQSGEKMTSPTTQSLMKPKKSPAAMKKFLAAYDDLFKCPEYACLFTTNKKKMFDIHIKLHSHQNDRRLSCLYCDKLVYLQDMANHYEQVHGMCRFSCTYCLYRCIAKDYMDVHQILAHPSVAPRMQLLAKRDVETDKKLISILSEATRSTTVPTYSCCNEEFVYYKLFVEHVENCAKNSNKKCFFKSELGVCGKMNNSAYELAKHWGREHGIYPLQCAYCEVGNFVLSDMMIHLVLEHPTLPPDIIDRNDMPKTKSHLGPPRAQCNFHQLVNDFRNDPSKVRLQVASRILAMPANSSPKVSTKAVNTYSKAAPVNLITTTSSGEHSVHTSDNQGIVSTKAISTYSKVTPVNLIPTTNHGVEYSVQSSQSNVLTKAVSTYSKITPVSLIPTTSTGISLLKSSAKTNMLGSGGVVYCLAPTTTNQNQLVKAIMLNNDSPTSVGQKVRLLSPVSIPPADTKFQMLKKVIPIPPQVPKLTPISSRIISIQQPVQLQAGNLKAATVEQESTLTEKEPVNAGEENADLSNLEEPMMMIDGNFGNKSLDEEVDPLSLEMEDPLDNTSAGNEPYATPLHEYDSDSKDQDTPLQKTGLIGYQLYRCAKCDISFPDYVKFKDHVVKSVECRHVNAFNKPFKCVHCNKYMKHHSNLLDHLGYHGYARFICSLCNKRYPHGNQVRHHMKSQHNVVCIVMQPLIQHKSNLTNDEFVVKPQTFGNVKTPIKDGVVEGDGQKSGDLKTVFYSHEAEDLPQKSILSYDITCGHCQKFKNKVRSNIVRHLLLHKNDKEFTVPDTAPVNPVPCLEKNEKMFDKMYNLASSSHAGGRMGGQQKGDAKSVDKMAEDNNYPAFVPANKRFQCCAIDCNYLCLEEGNLRHHLTALHMEDLKFVCVHCKKDLSDAVDVDSILKHLKLHELHLYKCSNCDFMHNLKHKIERHIGEKHKNKGGDVVVLRAMDSEPYDENQLMHAPFPVVMNQKSTKPWRCCMCKYRCHTQEEAEAHAKNKHDIDCRYKCALCTFKSNEMSEFSGHFKSQHPDGQIDIILAYHKEDETSDVNPENYQFDTTPLWLRDKPRVRHIRGILFEENQPVKKKSAPLKAQAVETGTNPSTTPSVAKKRKRSASTIIESPVVFEEGHELKEEPEVLLVKDSGSDVIVIDDDDEIDEVSNEKTTEDQDGQPKFDDIELLCTYGDVGIPLNKHFKCPKCDKYRTTKTREFVQHLAKEIKYFRFNCSICEEKFVTLESIKMHCIDHHHCSMKSIEPLPLDMALNRWLCLVAERQRGILGNLGIHTEELPKDLEDFLCSHETTHPKGKEVSQKTIIKCMECGFHVTSKQALIRHLKYNHPHLAFHPTATQDVEDASGGQQEIPKKRSLEAPEEKTKELKKPKMMTANLIAKDKYVCSICSEAFDSVPEMEFHGRDTHGGEVSYVVQTTSLSMEFGRNIYRCRYCATTGPKPSLEMHNISDHPGQKLHVYRFACGVCPAKFEVLKSFKHHFKSHELKETFYFDVFDKKVILKTRAASVGKNKIYSCPVCPYVSHSVNSTNIKTHLKIHAKPFQCELCHAQFKSRPDARTHHLKEHPHNTEMILERMDMLQKITELMHEVMNTVQPDNGILEKSEEEIIEVVPDIVDPNVEVVLEDPAHGQKEETSQNSRHFARKSTGSVVKRKEATEYYSFYGQNPEPVDMKKIVTTFEIGDAKMRMTCDQLCRIYNLNPSIVLKDCMTLIIEEDDDLDLSS